MLLTWARSYSTYKGKESWWGGGEGDGREGVNLLALLLITWQGCWLYCQVVGKRQVAM